MTTTSWRSSRARTDYRGGRGGRQRRRDAWRGAAVREVDVERRTVPAHPDVDLAAEGPQLVLIERPERRRPHGVGIAAVGRRRWRAWRNRAPSPQGAVTLGVPALHLACARLRMGGRLKVMGAIGPIGPRLVVALALAAVVVVLAGADAAARRSGCCRCCRLPCGAEAYVRRDTGIEGSQGREQTVQALP